MIDLSGYTGTEHYYKIDHFSGFHVTDGVKEMAEQFNAYWLASDILIYQKMVKSLQQHYFITWQLKQLEKGAELIACDGNNNELYKQDYYVTDFPFGKYISNMSDAKTFTLFFSNGVLYLPSEN